MSFWDSVLLVTMMPVLFAVGCAVALGAIICIGHAIQAWRDR